MIKVYQAQLRTANYYLAVLRETGELYDQGGESLKQGLGLSIREWSNITSRQLWVEAHSSEDEQVAKLCSEFPDAAPRLLDLRQHPRERIRWLEAALSAAQRLKDHAAEGRHLNSLGLAYLHLGEINSAIKFFNSSLDILSKAADGHARGEVLSNLGHAYANLGAPSLAIDYSDQALSIARKHQDFRNEGIALCNLGQSFYLMREFSRAIRFYEESLEISRKIGYLPGENLVLNYLGETYAILNKLEQAIEYYEQALIIAREISDRHGERDALRNLGQAYYDLDQVSHAIKLYEAALHIAREIGDLLVEAELLNRLGETYLAAGEDSQALSYYKRRLKIRQDLRSRRAVNVELFHEGALQKIVNVTDARQIKVQGPVISKNVTWLHISDTHFGKSDAHQYDENIVIESLLEDIGERIKKDGLKPDFIAVTGDLAFSGKSSQYELVCAFFEKLLSITDLRRERLFIVPGNHDVDRDLISHGAFSISKDLISRQDTNKILTSPNDRQYLFARFKGYAKFVDDYFKGHLVFDDDHYFYTSPLDIGGHRLAILGLNSSWLAASDEDKTLKLVIGERQTRAALNAAKEVSADLKIALLHHPFDWIRAFDQSDSMALLLNKCDFILHGHLHKAATTSLSNPDGSAVIIAGGACYETRDHPNSYNFVKLDLETNTGIIYFREYVDEQGGFWAKGVRLYKNAPDGMYEFKLPCR
jgi:tetratricopeptide (TPR) repeat protein/3',5'-cyclic AMP phosphodiesterase CpdA